MLNKQAVLEMAEDAGFTWLTTKDYGDKLVKFAEMVRHAEMERCLRIVTNGCGDSIIESGLTAAILGGDNE